MKFKAFDQEMIKDRYGNPLQKPKGNPTVAQSISAWYLINELYAIGYCHNWQAERGDIADYIQAITEIVDKAKAIIDWEEL